MPGEKLLAEYRQRIEGEYRRRTRKSLEIIEKGSKYCPGGDYRSGSWFSPYPVVSSTGKDCWITDVDGNTYLDVNNNYTSMVLGNSNAAVAAAIKAQVDKGPTIAASSENAFEWAQLICERIKSVEQVRFCTSGSEADMHAIRAARAFTGKDKILKMEGNYHGSYDPLETSAGWGKLPWGLPKSVEQDILVTPFNDEAAAEKIVSKYKNELACIIVEPVMGAAGIIPARKEYLHFLQKLCQDNGLLFIVDEVITFRLDVGGAQRPYGLKPDITVLGKNIGGGLPVGAFGGRADIMTIHFAGRRPKPMVHHSGTFVATLVGCAAGIAAVKELTAERIAHINKLGENLASGLRAILGELGIKGQVTGTGSLLQIHFVNHPVTNASHLFDQNRDVINLFQLCMLNRNVFMPARGFFAISTPTTQKEIDKALAASRDSLLELKPLIEEIAPEIVAR